MIFDAKVPLKLRGIQEWFAGIITQPIDEDSQINPIAPSGEPIQREADLYIVPSPALLPYQRIQIYNQQYWWRLLTTLQETYPLVNRLFGHEDFNLTIAIPYLQKYPPNHWSLNFVGKYLPKWVEEEYSASDRLLILNAAKIDCAYIDSFFVPHLTPLAQNSLPHQDDLSSLLDQKLNLQPHLHLFQLDYDLFKFRAEFLKQEPDYWLEHDFPQIQNDKTYYFALSRNLKNNVVWKEITSCEYHLLDRFQKGASIEEACEWIEKQDPLLYETAAANLHLWFQEWVIRQWLVLDNGQTSP